MYAVIETGGKQLKVSEGETVLVESWMAKSAAISYSTKLWP